MAARTWTGLGADANWSTALNWDGGASVPATTDSVTFDATGAAFPCTIDALGTWSGGTLTIDAAYLNTITQSSGINVNCAAFSQASGTFTGHSAATFTSTTFSVTGGVFAQGGAFVSTTFTVGAGTYTGSSATMASTTVTLNSASGNVTATSGTWTVSSTWNASAALTWNANGGTVFWSGGSSVTVTAANTPFNLVQINWSTNTLSLASGTFPLGANPTTNMGVGSLSITGTVTWSGTWSMNTGANFTTNSGAVLTGTSSPRLVLSGSVTIHASSTLTNPVSTITLVSGGTRTYTDTGDKFSAATIIIGDGSVKNLTIAASTICRLGTNPTSSMGTGTLTVTGTLNVSGSWTHTGSLTLTATTGTVTGALTAFNCGEGAITFNAGSAWPNGVNLNWTPTSSTARTFALNGETFGTFRRIGSASAHLTITGSNTFATFRDNDGLVAHTIKFKDGATQTAGAWFLAGSPGKTLTLDTDTGAGTFTLAKTGGGEVRASYCSITRSTVDASPIWTADPSCTNGGGNTNWIFGSVYFDQARQRKRGRRWIPLVA